MGSFCSKICDCDGMADGSDRKKLAQHTDTFMSSSGLRVKSLIPELAKKYDLNPETCLETFADSDQEISDWVEKQMGIGDKNMIQCIIISSRHVGKPARGKFSLVGIQTIASLTRLCPNLQVFLLNGHHLDQQMGGAFWEGIKTCEKLRHLDLFDNHISNEGAAFFHNNFSRTFKNLKLLVLAGNGNINAKTRDEINTAAEQRRENFKHLTAYVVTF